MMGKIPGTAAGKRRMGASTMLVRFTSYEDRQPCGEILSLAYSRAFPFRGADQMLLIMDDIMDHASCPQASLGHRTLYGKPYVFEELEEEEAPLEKAPWGSAGAGTASLAIRVYFRQYGSMQGELAATSRGKQEKVMFRSALELLRLTYEFLDGNMQGRV